jgi:opacity protein-like surface antigen
MKKALIFSLAALAVGAAQAQMYYAGIEVGTAKADLSDTASNARSTYALAGIPATVSTDDSTSAVRAFGGSVINPKTSFELGYFKTGEASITVRGTYLGYSFKEKETYSASGLDASALFKPFLNGFYLKGGIHSSKVESSYRLNFDGYSSDSFSDSDSGIGFLYGAGYEAAVAEGVNLRASFVRYQKLGGESDFDMDLITLGLSKSF